MLRFYLDSVGPISKSLICGKTLEDKDKKGKKEI